MKVKLRDLSNSFPDAELDLLLCHQALVYGFWYQIVDELVVQDYIQTDILMSGIWGLARDTASD
jgi:hypothetical protein